MSIQTRRGPNGRRYRARVMHKGHRSIGPWREQKWRAQEDEAAMLRSRADGSWERDYGPDRIPTFGEAADEFLEHVETRVERGDLAESTAREYRRHIRLRLRDRFAEYRLDEISSDQVEVFRRRLYRHVSGSTVNRYLTTLQGVFTLYRRRGVVNPVRGIDKYPESTDAWQAPSRKTVEHIIRHARHSGNEHLASIVLLLFDLAARVNEIRTLRWEQVDLDWCDAKGTRRGMIVWPKTKSGERQTLPMTTRAREELLRHREKFDSSWCFPSPVKDAPISYDALREAWVKVLEKAGVPPMRFHDLRHGRATQLIGMDVATEKVQRVGRWKSHQSMQRYVHMTASQAVDAFEAAEALPDEADVRDISEGRREKGEG